MKCWLSLDRWFDSGSKEFDFKFGTHVSTFSSYFVLPDKKKATCQDPNLSRVVNFFLVEAETRRRWDIFQAEVTLY